MIRTRVIFEDNYIAQNYKINKTMKMKETSSIATTFSQEDCKWQLQLNTNKI